jgi:hypothetical protein
MKSIKSNKYINILNKIVVYAWLLNEAVPDFFQSMGIAG